MTRFSGAAPRHRRPACRPACSALSCHTALLRWIVMDTSARANAPHRFYQGPGLDHAMMANTWGRLMGELPQALRGEVLLQVFFKSHPVRVTIFVLGYAPIISSPCSASCTACELTFRKCGPWASDSCAACRLRTRYTSSHNLTSRLFASVIRSAGRGRSPTVSGCCRCVGKSGTLASRQDGGWADLNPRCR